ALAGRVSTSDDHDATSTTRVRLRYRGAVVDSCTDTIGNAFGFMFAIGHAGRSQNGARHNFASVLKLQTLVSAFDRNSRDLQWRQEFRAQALRLRNRAPRQFGSADP